MKLHASDMISRSSGGESLAIRAARDDRLRVVRRRIEAVDEIHEGIRGEPGPECVRREVERVPADLRHLHAGRGKAAHFPSEESEAAHPGRFLALLEEHLVADADAEKWNPAVEHIAHHMPKPAFLEPAHAVPKCADARQHDFFRARNLRRIGGEPHVRAERFQRIEDAAHIAGAVVNKGDHGEENLWEHEMRLGFVRIESVNRD